MDNLPPLWPHQLEVLEKTNQFKKLMYLHSPRLGKSRISLEFLKSILWGLERPIRAIIASPLVVCPQWAKLLTMGLEDAFIEVYEGYKHPTPTISAWLSRTRGGILIVNDDKIARLVEPILKWSADLFIGDESHRYKGPSSKRGKAVRKICWQTPYVRLLTGTPTPNNVGNLWGQMTCVDQELWGRSYNRFAHKFLIRDCMYPSKILGVLHPQKIREMLLQCSSIVRREDVFGQDQWQVVVREIELPMKAMTLYKTLVKDWIAVDSLHKGETIDVTHKLKRIIRLQQLTSGFIPDELGNIHQVHSAKYDAVVSDLEEIVESGEKVVIFHQFIEEGRVLYERTIKEYGESRVFRINGSITGDDRARAIREFELLNSGGVIVVQTDSGGIGISLASASHVFFVSQGFSFDAEQQARDRIYRPNVGKCVSYYRVAGTVDYFIAKILANKENFHEAVTHADLRELAFNEFIVELGKEIL